MTVAEIAKLEQVSPRQIQRYCSVGFQGHILPTAKIAEQDYREWRIACGFEQAAAALAVPSTESVERPYVSQDEAPAPCAVLFPPWPQCANPNGELTLAPHEHSRNWPHPLACEEHRKDELRKQQIRIRGYADDTE